MLLIHHSAKVMHWGNFWSKELLQSAAHTTETALKKKVQHNRLPSHFFLFCIFLPLFPILTFLALFPILYLCQSAPCNGSAAPHRQPRWGFITPKQQWVYLKFWCNIFYFTPKQQWAYLKFWCNRFSLDIGQRFISPLKREGVTYLFQMPNCNQ